MEQNREVLRWGETYSRDQAMLLFADYLSSIKFAHANTCMYFDVFENISKLSRNCLVRFSNVLNQETGNLILQVETSAITEDYLMTSCLVELAELELDAHYDWLKNICILHPNGYLFAFDSFHSDKPDSQVEL